MCEYDLIVDPEFKRLLPELNSDEKKILEESILAEGCRDPIVLWDHTIVDGHNRYEICRKHHLPYKVEQVDFSERAQAIRWICLNQIGRRNISPELLRYQIGKRYNMEKLLTAHNPQGKNQYTEVPSDIMMQPQNSSRMGAAAAIGREYNVSHFAVHTYKDIARDIDAIAEKDERLVERYLSGQLRIKKDDLDVISGMAKGQVRALTNALIRNNKTICRTQDVLDALSHRDLEKENLAARERRMASSKAAAQPSVKTMPSYDPDGEVASLSLTIPSWNSSMDRLFNQTNFKEISKKAKAQLKAALLTLRDSIDIVLLAIEEVSDDER